MFTFLEHSLNSCRFTFLQTWGEKEIGSYSNRSYRRTGHKSGGHARIEIRFSDMTAATHPLTDGIARILGTGLGSFRKPSIGQVHHRYSVWPANRSVNQTDMRNWYLKFVNFLFFFLFLPHFLLFLPQSSWICYFFSFFFLNIGGAVSYRSAVTYHRRWVIGFGWQTEAGP